MLTAQSSQPALPVSLPLDAVCISAFYHATAVPHLALVQEHDLLGMHNAVRRKGIAVQTLQNLMLL